jgi:hypothetical protein
LFFGFGQFGFVFPEAWYVVFDALWSGRKAMCTKGVFVALPGERSEALMLRPLRGYLGEFFPCVVIWILWFQ